jgi:Nucleotidyltransferase of unknown function (DUF6036)
MSPVFFSKDIVDFLFLLSKYDVKYVIVGGEAVIYYGHARLTGDIDIFYELSKENAQKLFQMLNNFWDNDIPGVKKVEELMNSGEVFQFGVPPNRIDLLNLIENVEFEEAWNNRKEDTITLSDNDVKIYYIGLRELIKNKESLNRYRDKDDLIFLKKIQNQK